MPWGISESAYNLVDRHGTYQYKAFGVPGLGLKRGLGDELVVAPYATALAMAVDPGGGHREPPPPGDGRASTARYGFYDAIDYTHRGPDALGPGEAAAGRGRGRPTWRITRA